MQISVRGVLTEVFLAISALGLGPIRQDVNFELLTVHELEAVHALSSDSCLLVSSELNDGVTAILPSVGVFRQLDRVNRTEWAEELPDVLLGQRGEVTDQASNVDAIVRLTLLVLIAGRKSVAQ